VTAALPRPAGSALPRAPPQQIDNASIRSPTPPRQHEYDRPDNRQRRSSRSADDRRSRSADDRRSRSVDDRRGSITSPPPLMSVDVSLESRYRPKPTPRGSGYRKLGLGQNCPRVQRRESALSRLGPKTRITQRLGAVRGRLNRSSTSRGNGNNSGRYFKIILKNLNLFSIFCLFST